MDSRFKLFAGTASKALGSNVALEYGTRLGDVTLQRFSDGEMSAFYNESIRGRHIFLIQSTYAPTDNLFELLMMIDAAKRASADYIAAVVPYFGYARQDRKDKPRVGIASKLVANLLTTAGANRLITMDLHAAQIQGFFDIPVDHLDSSYIFVPYIRELGLDNLVIAAPDVGSSYRARVYANHLEAGFVVCDKFRKVANKIESLTVIGDVKDKNVILIDDLVDTGNTLAKASGMIMEKGARSVRAFCTHPVLSGKAYETIENSVLEELVVSDTIPLKEEISKIHVLSVAELFATAIRHTHEYSSIASLFINTQK